jgi:hypothetical protein
MRVRFAGSGDAFGSGGRQGSAKTSPLTPPRRPGGITTTPARCYLTIIQTTISVHIGGTVRVLCAFTW